MSSRRIMHIATGIGLCFMPILFRRRYRKQSFILFIFSAISNILISSLLMRKHHFSYPVRYFPKTFKSSIVYDWLIGPSIFVLYCQTTSNSSYSAIVGQSMVYSAFQTLIEYWILIKTRLIQYNESRWSIWHTFASQALYKVCLIRVMWSFIVKFIPIAER